MRKAEVMIGSAKAVPGQKGKGFIHVANRPDGTPINIPIIILNGADAGPVLCVDACNHGDEYETMEAVLRVVEAVNPAELKGTLLAVPVVNVLAHEAMQRVNPNDKYSYSDINRIYPGRLDGSITQKIAYHHFHQVVSRAEYLITLHGGGNYLLLPPKTLYYRYDGELGEKTLNLAKAFGWDILWVGAPLGSCLLIAAGQKGIAGINCEFAGGSDRAPANLDRNVGFYAKGILNVMKYLGMISGSPEIPKKFWVIEGEVHIFSKHGGVLIFEPGLQSKQKVKKGQKLGRIINLLGEEVESINAEFDGLVHSMRTYPLIHSGEWAIGVSRIVEEGE